MNSKKEWLQNRLAFDFRVVMEMARQSQLIDVQAFANRSHLAKRERRIHSISQGKMAGYYLVHYKVRSLVGPDKYHTGFDVVFDLISEKSYPEERSGSSISAGGIVATCVSDPKPWSPHFLGSSGTVCLGSIWQGAEHTLLAHVIIHVARLLNWDEPMDHVYGGWNPKAVEWWRKNLNSRPITSGLQYPSLPTELTHGTSASSQGSNGSCRSGNDRAREFRIVNVTNATSQTSSVSRTSKRIIRI
jgi:hypothetical protein